MNDRFNPRLSPNEEAVAEKARPAKRLPILCLDFDGVLHGYQSGWQGAAIIPDPPVPGAVEFLHSAVERFQVAIYSSRSGQPGGIDAMRGWLTMWLLAVIEDRREAEHVLSLIQWPTEKPAATVTIDDRAIQFTGEWPSLDEIDGFKPWNKRPAPDSPLTGPVGVEEEPGEIQAIADLLRHHDGTTRIRRKHYDTARAIVAALAARPAAPEAQGAWTFERTRTYLLAELDRVRADLDTVGEDLTDDQGKANSWLDVAYGRVANIRSCLSAMPAIPSSGQGGR